jgi:hypothetical protein
VNNERVDATGKGPGERVLDPASTCFVILEVVDRPNDPYPGPPKPVKPGIKEGAADTSFRSPLKPGKSVEMDDV